MRCKKMFFRNPPKYNFSIVKDLKLASFIGVIVLGIVGVLSNNWISALLIGLGITTLFFYKSKNWYKYYILSIKFKEEQVEIHFKEKGENKYVIGNVNKFKVNKKMGFSNARIPYLIIKSDIDNVVISQYEISEWNEAKMDDVIKLFWIHSNFKKK